MLESLKMRFACSKRKRLLKRLKDAVANDRAESERRRILKIQMHGLKPEFLNYVQ